jgi:hypothetical protein
MDGNLTDPLWYLYELRDSSATAGTWTPGRWQRFGDGLGTAVRPVYLEWPGVEVDRLAGPWT